MFRYISKYPHTYSNYELYHIDEQIWRKSFLVFCDFLLYVHYQFNSFLHPSAFSRLSIHIHIVLRFSLIIFQQCFFRIYFYLYPGVSWKFQAAGDYSLLFYFFVYTTVILKRVPRNEIQVLFHCSHFEKKWNFILGDKMLR